MMAIEFADFDLSEIFGKPDLAEVDLIDCLKMEIGCCLWLES